MINQETILNTNINFYGFNAYEVPPEIYQSWVYKLTRSNNLKMLSESQKHRLALTSQMHALEAEGRTLVHFSVTYKLKEGEIELSETEINNIFTAFYMRKFLPFLLGTNKFHTEKFKAVQPICFCFVDDGVHKAKLDSMSKYIFPSRLHHHAILAIHPDTLDKMNELVGEGTLFKHNLANHDISKQWLKNNNIMNPNIDLMYLPKNITKRADFNRNWLLTNKIMTSDIKQCDAGRLLYASKMLGKYPDFMSFPDSF